MNPIYPLLGLAGYIWAVKSIGGSSHKLTKGRAYVATFRLPNSDITPEQLAAVLPLGASLQPDAQNLIVTFNAPRDAEIGDIPTPLGTLKLVSLRELSDIVGASGSLIPPPAVYSFSWWQRDQKGNYRFSGWTKPQTMAWSAMNETMVRRPASQEYRRVLMWDGSRWIDAP